MSSVAPFSTVQSADQALPATTGALSLRRRLLGIALALVVGPPLTWSLDYIRGTEFETTAVLSYMLLVVGVALVGGWWPALFAAVLSGLSLDFMLMPPYYTVRLQDPAHVLTIVLYVVVALLVSYVVDKAARRARIARRAQAESELLTTVAGSVLRGESAAQALVARTREAFGATGVRLLTPSGTIIAADGEPAGPSGTPGAPVVSPVTDRAILEVYGARLGESERRVLDTIVAQIDGTLERAELTAAAAEARERAAANQVRSAILRAVSHDVRRPLAAATAAVGGLTVSGLTPQDREELVSTAEESLTALAALVDDLLDVSRIQAKALAVQATETDLTRVVAASISELALTDAEVTVQSDHTTAYVDPVLLQRALVNLLANARRYSPPGRTVDVTSHHDAEWVTIHVVDHGPGIDPHKQEDMFLPFQRLGDTDNTTGLGLGLALSRGFVEGMAGTLTTQPTPGGGLTMVVQVPRCRS